MNYLEWNNLVAEYFFNPKNGGKDVYLYLTKIDIIKLVRQENCFSSDESIWADFVNAIKIGLPGSSGNIASRAKSCYDRRNLVSIDKTPIRFPPYISYLVFFVLPLTEDLDGDYNSNNYYGRLNRLLTDNSIDQTLGVPDFRDNNINLLWSDLENWANIKHSGDLGWFRAIPFKNTTWIYVGKPFSQCILPPSTTAKLSELFLQAGMIPNSFYPDSELKKILLTYGPSVLSLNNNVIELVRKSEANELGQTVLEIIKREYNKWSGETHQDISNGSTQKIKRDYTVIPLFLQFKINDNDGLITFSFRAYSSNDYPEDLNFGGLENIYEANGWSKTLHLSFQDSFQLEDNFNKWIARFPRRDVRIFVNAGHHQLSAGYWIETDSLSKTDQMYLLCRNEKRDSISEWGRTFKSGDFRMEDVEGLPENHSLFKLFNPIISHPEIPLLTLYVEKRIELIGGVKVNFRTFINDFEPEVEITNSDGNERVYLQYRNTEEKLFLEKKPSYTNRWGLPAGTLLNIDFNLKVEGETISGNEIAYNLTSANKAAYKVDTVELPKRDSFGKRIEGDSNQYCLGSDVINPHKSSIRLYSPFGPLFTSTNQDTDEVASTSTVSANNHSGNMLCGFLSLKKVLTTADFFGAFEFYYSKEFSERRENETANLTGIKKTALNFYDYIGILDYDYETKKIVVNPPQLIFIPTLRGRRVLLIGARDRGMIQEIVNTAPEYSLQVEIATQLPSNEKLLLPDVITIKAFGTPSEGYGEKDLIAFSKKLRLKFSNDYFCQIALQEFSSGISEYENSKQLTDENDYDWARKVFNILTLNFERDESLTFDKSCSLIEYKLNEYTLHYKLWENGKCYQVDRNWGKYLVLKRFNKNVILFDSSRNRVAVPLETPLPRLLSESIMLLSGLAPGYQQIDGRNYRVHENIPGIFTENLFHKLGQQPVKRDLR